MVAEAHGGVARGKARYTGSDSTSWANVSRPRSAPTAVGAVRWMEAETGDQESVYDSSSPNWNEDVEAVMLMSR
jgi:hypothetical protein